MNFNINKSAKALLLASALPLAGMGTGGVRTRNN